MRRVVAAGFAWVAMSSAAAAHPGHGAGGGDFSLAHFVSEPVHAVAALLALAAVVGARLLARSRRASTARRA